MLYTEHIKLNIKIYNYVMKTFNENIQTELETIREFNNKTGKNVKMRKLENNGYSSYDFTYSLNNKTIFYTEVKTRRCSSTLYRDTILEVMKVDKINSIIKEHQKLNNDYILKAGLLVKFTDCMMFFDINELEEIISEKLCPKTSSSDGRNDMVYKKMYHYNISDGKRV
jgi:hypothetical protein